MKESSGRSQNFSVSKSKVKFDFTTVRTRIIPILKRVQIGDYPAKIGRTYGWSKQHVSYYLNKLEKAGLVCRKRRSSAVFLELTLRGQNFLGSCEGILFGSGVFRLDKVQYRYPILAEGLLPADFRRIEMQNWTALLGLEQGVKVRHTSRSWIVHVETLCGRSPGELFTLSKNLADRVAKGLMIKYGCRLADGEICKGHEIAIDDPVAQLLSRYFTVGIPGKCHMDHSPGELEGEIDFTQRDMAVEYLLMPERVKKLEGQLTALNCDLERISGSLENLTVVLGKLCGANEENNAPKSAGGSQYVT
jgi:DNA-binding MarR family transcriptional regulator